MRHSKAEWIIPAILAGVLFFGCGRNPGERLYREAMKQWESGDPVRARTLLERSIRRRAGHADNAAALNQLGLLLWQTGDTAAAVEAFSESIRLAPGQFEVLCNLGVALGAAGDVAGAEQALREAALIHPQDIRPFVRAGLIHAKSQNWSDASRNLLHALSSAPDDPALNNALALVELHTSGADAAMRRLRTVISRHPDYAPARFNLASIQFLVRQNREEARRGYAAYLDRAVADDGFREMARFRMLALSGPVATNAARDPAAAQEFFRKAFALQREGRHQQAATEYLNAVEADPRHAQAFHNLGLAYYSLDRIAEAGRAFDRALELNPEFTGARYNKALVLYRLGRIEQAASELNALLAQDPGYQPARALLESLPSGGR